jgi:hypothetical protein
LFLNDAAKLRRIADKAKLFSTFMKKRAVCFLSLLRNYQLHIALCHALVASESLKIVTPTWQSVIKEAL